MGRKCNLAIKGAPVHNIGAIPCPCHCLGQTIPLLHLCVVNVKEDDKVFTFHSQAGWVGLITELCFEHEMCYIMFK